MQRPRLQTVAVVSGGISSASLEKRQRLLRSPLRSQRLPSPWGAAVPLVVMEDATGGASIRAAIDMRIRAVNEAIEVTAASGARAVMAASARRAVAVVVVTVTVVASVDVIR